MTSGIFRNCAKGAISLLAQAKNITLAKREYHCAKGAISPRERRSRYFNFFTRSTVSSRMARLPSLIFSTTQVLRWSDSTMYPKLCNALSTADNCMRISPQYRLSASIFLMPPSCPIMRLSLSLSAFCSLSGRGVCL